MHHQQHTTANIWANTNTTQDIGLFYRCLIH